MKITVFCSSSDKIDPDFFHLAEALGEWIGKNGHTLVFGGCDKGLMRDIGLAVHKNGGRTIGVVPRIIEKDAKITDSLDVEIPVENLSDRKDIMVEQANIVIALPCGIGTLDEIFTTAASGTIGYHNKKVILYNMKNYWDKTLELLADMKEKGMISGEIEDVFTVVSSLEEIAEICQKV